MLSLVTLGVRDLARASRFYVEGLGGRVVLALPEVVFVQAAHGVLLSLWDVDELRADSGTAAFSAPEQAPFALAHNVASEQDVEVVLERAVAAGGALVRGAVRAPWGGLQAYVCDPDGFRWEVAHNPGLHVHGDGRVELRAVGPAPAVTVRPATPRDAVDIARIQAQGVASGVASFETEAPTPAEVLHRIVCTTAPHAFLVAESDGRVTGWAASTAYSPRDCYAGIGEVAVYVDAAAQGRGTGARLLGDLRERCRGAGLHKLLARLLPATPAQALFAHAGFREAGLLQRHGLIGGQWRDCLVVEDLLDGAAPQPGPTGARP